MATPPGSLRAPRPRSSAIYNLRTRLHPTDRDALPAYLDGVCTRDADGDEDDGFWTLRSKDWLTLR